MRKGDGMQTAIYEYISRQINSENPESSGAGSSQVGHLEKTQGDVRPFHIVHPAAYVLEARGLRKNFGKDEILKDISFSIKKGEVVAILGPSGCGKSTLLRCLNGLEEIQVGTISLNGEDIHREKKKLPEIRQKIGMVFQNYELFPHLTIEENLSLGPVKIQKREKKEVLEEIDFLLKRVGLSDKKKVYPRQLSGGQKQRVAIVRALCMHPEIILFDEVTAALDPEMVQEVLRVIEDLSKDGITMAIVTHEMQFAKAVADRIIFMDEGIIVEESAPDLFFSKPKTSRAEQFLQTFRYEALG